jgi:hypothetical protein
MSSRFRKSHLLELQPSFRFENVFYFNTVQLAWLLLWGGIVQSEPCNCDHSLIYCATHLSSDNFRFIQQSSLLQLLQRHLIEKQGEAGREMASEFRLSVSIIRQGFLTCHKILQHGVDGFSFPTK